MDDLTALLDSRDWVKRRVDRVEFLDLSAVRRTITLELDLDELARLRSPAAGLRHLIPLGWFMPWANAGAMLVDADERALPYLTSGESDERVAAQVERRLDALLGDGAARLEPVRRAVREHRRDPGQAGSRCVRCRDVQPDAGLRVLMVEKWGCHAVRDLLVALRGSLDANGSEERVRATEELARLLLAWQTNFVLFAGLDASGVPGERATVRLAYDEQLSEWEPPWERRVRVLGRSDGGLSSRDAVECRGHISRGGPFYEELEALEPRWPGKLLARGRRLWLRRIGRRGLLGVAWHVAWHQASGLDVEQHHVDVVLPNELTAVRMRMLRMRDGAVQATVADQVGTHATIVAPEVDHAGAEAAGGDGPAGWYPTLFSLVITQCSAASWYGGAGIAALTGVALLVGAFGWLEQIVRHAEAGTALLLLAPTLVATVLAVRASSEIAGQLAVTLRRLIAAVGVLAAICAAGVILQPGPPEPDLVQRVLGRDAPVPDDDVLQAVWIVAGLATLAIAVTLLAGAHRIRRLIAYGQRAAPRYVDPVEIGKVLNPDDAPRISPPDRWLNVDEGDLIPWGWLHGQPGLAGTTVDTAFWDGALEAQLVDWVRGLVGYRQPVADPAPVEQVGAAL